MKKVLGLDLGVTSIGWALVLEGDEKKEILSMGSRIIPISTEDKNEFTSGNAITKNQNRTLKRTQRKGYDRYQLRRKYLVEKLKTCKMYPDESMMKISKLDLWQLRSNAVDKKVSLTEIGRILLHLNQKRGYRSSRSEANLDKKDTEYVAKVKSRYSLLKEEGLTIGQKFFQEFVNDSHYRIKDQVFPREAYFEEFEKILTNQSKFYPEIINSDFIREVRDEIIYYQRRLKSQKKLVSICEFEGFWTKIKIGENEKEIFVGPRVAPKSSPIFQVSKIWETINNITIRKKNGEYIILTALQKNEIIEHLDNNDKLTFVELLKILNLKKDDVYGNKQLLSGLQGNKTKVEIKKCFADNQKFNQLFDFNLQIHESDEDGYLLDKNSGEILDSKRRKVIDHNFEEQPLYRLWHTIYSISEKVECKNALMKKFSMSEEIADKLASIDFTKSGFGNKSNRAIRKILPYMMEGDGYSVACSFAGYNHSNSLTKDENYERKLFDRLKLLDKNSLRQPIVEKILNQMINVVNVIIEKYGKPDEIRVELARELKLSRDERNDAFKYMNQRTKENQIIERELQEFGLRATRNNIIKYRLYHEISGEDKKQNAICIYCGNPISFSSAILGEEVDIEHIIPKSRIFDDSQSNKTLSHRRCNATKGDKTAFDFMKLKSENDFNSYIERVNTLYKNKLIGKGKRDKYLTPGNKIPNDFIERQLRETQYISKKAREILQSICHNVWATSGEITSELRHIWGWDDVLMNLQLPKYRNLGLTELKEVLQNESITKKEIIPGWSKRDDHRHHAIDALTIACTKQSFVQRFNTLNSEKTRKSMFEEISNFDNKKSLLENFVISQKPFSTRNIEDEVSKILVSFKSGKKVASIGKRKIRKNGKLNVVQEGIVIPRGALSEESIYGKIKTLVSGNLKYIFNNPHLIFKDYIRKLVEERLSSFNGDVKKALTSLKKDPIYLDEHKKIVLEYATCFHDEIVIKKPIQSLNEKQVNDIVDPVVRQKVLDRLEKFGGKAKEAFKNLEDDPIWFNEKERIPIKTVRWFSGLSAVEPIKKDDEGNSIGFVKPGNNHHIAIYLDENNLKQITICTFWHAVERKKYGLPIIIKNPAEVIDKILEEDEDKYPETFLEKLPNVKWQFIESFQQNEMFILGMNEDEFNIAMKTNNHKVLSDYLYRVQKLFYNGKALEIFFRHHLETQLNDDTNSKISKRFYQVQSLGVLESLNPKKVKINLLGEIFK